MLRLESVVKRYSRTDGERVALDDVSLSVARGQLVGVFGASGSGKTTLLRVAAGLVRPDAGSVTYNGERLGSLTSAARARLRRREIACVWPDAPALDGLDVLDHVVLPLLIDHRDRRSAERLAVRALLACEVDYCARMALDDLSDGERERVALARAIATEPRILLADAPVSRLSFIEQEQIMALLTTLAEDAKVGVLLTSSDAESLPRCDSVFYLKDGKLLTTAGPAPVGRVYQFPRQVRGSG